MQALGPYRLREELGRGGMGVVYRAEDSRDGRVVALKVLLDTSADLELLERFRREATLLHRIQHPNLVRVFDLNMRPPRPYAAFEYVEGQTLEARVGREGPLPWRDAVQVLTEVAAGLEAAHRAGLLHRDIKPENVLLAPGGAKLADFGMVRDASLESLTMTGALVGSPKFMAPELALGDKARWGPSTDVYGMSATLYFALSGQPPFDGASSIEIMTRVIEDPPPRPSARNPEVPGWLDALCLRGLAKDDADRPPSALAFFSALRAGLQAQPAPRTSRRRVAQRTDSRRVGQRADSRRVTQPAGRKKPMAWVGGLLLGAGLLSGLAVAGVVLWPAADGTANASDPSPPGDALSLLSDGRDHLAAQRYEDALVSLDRTLELDPSLVAAYPLRARARLNLEDSEGALRDAQHALQVLESDADRAGAVVTQALALSNLGRLEEGLSVCSESLRARPTAEVLGCRGQLHLRSKRPDAAHEDYSRAIELEPSVAAYFSGRGAATLQRGRPGEALRDLDRALELGARTPQLLANRAACLVHLDRLREAATSYAQALELDPRNAIALYDGAQTAWHLGDDATALAYLERAIALDPDTELRARSLRSTYYAKQGRPDLALEDADRALELDPRDPRYAFLRGMLKGRLGRYGEALFDLDRAVEGTRAPSADVFAERAWIKAQLRDDLGTFADAERALTLDPKLGVAYAALAWGYGGGGQWQQAAQAARQAMDLSPARSCSWAAQGMLLAARRDFQGAAEAYSRAVELDPYVPRYRVMRGMVLATLGRRDEAFADTTRALELDSNLPECLALRGALLAQAGQPEQGLELLNRAIELEPSPGMYQKRGLTHETLSSLEQAQADYARWTQLDPGSYEAWTSRGRCLVGLRRAREALPVLARAIELAPQVGNGYLYRGHAHALLGDRPAALADYELALERGLGEVSARETGRLVQRLRAELGLAPGE